MVYKIEGGNLVAVAQTLDESAQMGAKEQVLGTRTQLVESKAQAQAEVNRWQGLIETFDRL